MLAQLFSTIARFFSFGHKDSSREKVSSPVSENIYLPQIKEALDLYLTDIQHHGATESTVRNYSSDISQFVEFTQEINIQHAMQAENFERFYHHQQAKGLKEASIVRKLASLKQFAKWLEKQGWLSDLIATPVETKPPIPDLPHPLPEKGQKFFWFKGIKEFPAFSPLATRLERFSIVTALHIFTLVVFSAFLLIFGYKQLFSNVVTPLAFPSDPTRPQRVFSFQGRLTDAASTPITTATNTQFRLYDAASSGNLLWSSGTCSIDPDQDGIFSTLLGSDCGSEIASSVFSENQGVWLEIQVGSETLTPRQQLATVAYALNAETLQGFPISASESATVNTVVVMNEYGEIVLGEQSPKLKSVSGTFTVEGQSLLLQTTAGSNGDITIAPDGTGQTIIDSDLDLSGIASTSGTLTFRGTSDPKIDILNGENFGLRTSPGGDTGLTERFTVLNNGNVGVGDTSPASLFTVGANDAFQVNSSGAITSATGVTSSGSITFSGLSNGLVRSTSGVLSGAGTVNLASEVSGILPIANGGTNANSIGSAGSVAYSTGTAYGFTAVGSTGECLVSAGAATPTWGSCSDAVADSVMWQEAFGSAQLKNTTLDLLVGGTASSSAKFAFLNVNSGTPTASISGSVAGNALFMTGDGTISTSKNRSLAINPNGGYVGIGTANPTASLEVAGENGGTVRLFNDSVNGRQFNITRSGAMTTLHGARTDLTLDVWQNSGDRNVIITNSGGYRANLTVSGKVGIGTTTPVAPLHLHGTQGGNAAAIIDQRNSGDILTASASGISRFVITNSGNVGIGTTSPASALNLSGSGATRLLIDTTNAASDTGIGFRRVGVAEWQMGRRGTDGSFRIGQSSNLDVSNALTVLTSGNIGIGTTTPVAKLDVNGSLTASGTITFSTFSTNGGLLYTNGSGVLAQTAAGANGECLISAGGGAPAWGSCSSAVADSVAWQVTSGAASLKNTSLDMLVGGTASSSAKFAFLNVNSGTPTASISGSVAGNALSLTGDGTIATSNNRSLSLNPNGGYVGIGTSSPTAKLQVHSADATTIGQIIRGAASQTANLQVWQNSSGTFLAGVSADGHIGVGTNTDPSVMLKFLSTTTSTSTFTGIRGTINNNPSGDTSAGYYGGFLSSDTLSGNSANFTGNVTGINASATHNGSGTVNNLIGAGFNARKVGTGSVSNAFALDVLSWGNSNTTGTITNAAGLRIYTPSTAGAITNLYGIWVRDIIGGTNNHAIYTNAGNVILNAGNDSSSRVGIGDTTPAYMFTVGNGDLFGVNSSGAIAAATGITSSGTINFTGTFQLAGTTISSTATELNYLDGTTITAGGVIYANGTNLANTGVGLSGQCLISNVSAAPTWGDCDSVTAGSSNWNITAGTIQPINTTLDLLIGGTSTASAKFAVLNVNSGTPTASISGTTGSTYLTASGTLQATNNQQLTIGGNTTGSIYLNPGNGAGTVGVGTLPSLAKFTIKSNNTNTFPLRILSSDNSEMLNLMEDLVGNSLLTLHDANGNSEVEIYAHTGSGNLILKDSGSTSVSLAGSGASYFDGGNVGIGDTTPAALFTVGSGDPFQINEFGTILAVAGITNNGDLTVEGNTTLGNASGDTLTINSNALAVPNNLNIDTNTLYIDATNNRVAVGTTNTAGGAFIASSSGNIAAARFFAPDLTSNNGIDIVVPLSSNVGNGKAFGVYATGESFARSIFYSDGSYGVGPGGGSTRDVFLDRESANTFRISNNRGSGTGNLIVTGNIAANSLTLNGTTIATNSLWSNTSNVYHPAGAYAGIADLAIGGTSTASAKLHFNATTGDITSSNTAVSINDDLQIKGGDILGNSGETRITIDDSTDKTLISGALDVTGILRSGGSYQFQVDGSGNISTTGTFTGTSADFSGDVNIGNSSGTSPLSIFSSDEDIASYIEFYGSGSVAASEFVGLQLHGEQAGSKNQINLLNTLGIHYGSTTVTAVENRFDSSLAGTVFGVRNNAPGSNTLFGDSTTPDAVFYGFANEFTSADLYDDGATIYGLYNNLAGHNVGTSAQFLYGTYSVGTTYSQGGDLFIGNYVASDGSSTGGSQYAYYADLSAGTATKYGLYLTGEVNNYLSGNLELDGNLQLGDSSSNNVSVASSSWSFLNDTNFSLSGGVNGLSIDGTTFSVDATNDRIGIGTSAPAYKLDVFSLAGAQLRLAYDASNYTGFNVGSGGNLTISPTGGYLTVDGVLNSTGSLNTGAGQGTVRIDVDGNALNMRTITSNSSAPATTDLGLYSSGSTSWMRFTTNNGNFQWYSNFTNGASSSPGTTAQILTLTPAGQLYGEYGSITTPTYSFEGSQNTGMWADASHNLRFSTAGSLRATLNANGINVVDAFYTTAGTMVVVDQGVANEGGELVLLGQGANGQVNIDNHTGNMRFIRAGSLIATINNQGIKFGNARSLVGGAPTCNATYEGEVIYSQVTGVNGNNGRLYYCRFISGGTYGWVGVNGDSTATGQPDLAEYIHVSDMSIEAGDLIQLSNDERVDENEYDRFTGEKAASNSALPIMGVVSTDPGLILNNPAAGPDDVVPEDLRPLALAGRVPVKVKTSGTITKGSYITASDLPGYGKVAISAGQVVGHTLTSFSPTNQTCTPISDPSQADWSGESFDRCFALPDGTFLAKVLLFVDVDYYNPDVQLAANGSLMSKELIQDLLLNDEDVKNTLQQSVQNLLSQMSTLVVNASQLIANIGVFNQKVETPQLATDMISPLSGEDLTLSIGNNQSATSSGTLIVENSRGQEVFSINEDGDASVSGEITASSARLKALEAQLANLDQLNVNDATVAGQLYLKDGRSIDQILSDNESYMSQLLASSSAQAQEIANESYSQFLTQLTGSQDAEIATAIQTLQAENIELTSQDVILNADAIFIHKFLNVTGVTQLATVNVTNTLRINNDLSLDANGISSQSNLLALQPSGLGQVKILGDLLVLNDSGKVEINGDLSVTGKLATNALTPNNFDQDLEVQLATQAGQVAGAQSSKLSFRNAENNEVANITASGSARFAQLETQGVTISQKDLEEKNKTTGTKSLTSGQTEIVIENNHISDDALIYLTPTTNTDNQVLFVKAKNTCQDTTDCQKSFTVGINAAVGSNINFNYWIVKTTN